MSGRLTQTEVLDVLGPAQALVLSIGQSFVSDTVTVQFPNWVAMRAAAKQLREKGFAVTEHDCELTVEGRVP